MAKLFHDPSIGNAINIVVNRLIVFTGDDVSIRVFVCVRSCVRACMHVCEGERTLLFKDCNLGSFTPV